MYNLLRKKIAGIRHLMIFSLLASSMSAFSQEKLLHLPNHDDKKYYIGIGVLYNTSRFQLHHDPNFLASDSVMMIDPQNGRGFGIAGMHTYRLSPRFEIRAIFPQFLLTYTNLTYHLKYPDPSKEEHPVMSKKIESILLGLPVQIKFRSDRIDNFRVYVFGGGKIEYDLASNARAKRAEELVKLKKTIFGIEAGIGFNFYMPSIIISPEIKISNGLTDSHSRDASLKFSNVIDKLNSRMVVFSLILEG
jgi:Outer membrane protein beta-barrel domain